MKPDLKMTTLDWLVFSGHCATNASVRRLCHHGAVVQGDRILNIDDVPDFPTVDNPIKIGKRSSIICCDPKIKERIFHEQTTPVDCG